MLDKHSADVVVLPQEVLCVERCYGLISHKKPPGEGIVTAIEQQKAGFPRVLAGGEFRGHLSQRRAAEIRRRFCPLWS